MTLKTKLWHAFGLFQTFQLGFWAAAIMSAWLVHRQAFPDVGAPSWRWATMGAVHLLGAFFAFQLARPAKVTP